MQDRANVGGEPGRGGWGTLGWGGGHQRWEGREAGMGGGGMRVMGVRVQQSLVTMVANKDTEMPPW